MFMLLLAFFGWLPILVLNFLLKLGRKSLHCYETCLIRLCSISNDKGLGNMSARFVANTRFFVVVS